MEETIKKIRKGENITKEMYAEIKKKISTEICKNIEVKILFYDFLIFNREELQSLLEEI